MEIQTILIVDDDRPLVQLLKEHIFLRGIDRYVVKTAYNGQEALESLESEETDLIILDLQMPEMDGVQFLIELYNRKIWIPVIVLTGSKREEIREKFNDFVSFGIVDYLQKPISLEELDQRIEKIMRIRVQRDKISGLSLHGILQVLEMERKTAVINLNIQEKVGKIFVREGDVMDVEYDNLSPDDALEECVKHAQGNHIITIEYMSHNRKKTIKKSMTEMLLDATRMWDEKKKDDYF